GVAKQSPSKKRSASVRRRIRARNRVPRNESSRRAALLRTRCGTPPPKRRPRDDSAPRSAVRRPCEGRDDLAKACGKNAVWQAIGDVHFVEQALCRQTETDAARGVAVACADVERGVGVDHAVEAGHAWVDRVERVRVLRADVTKGDLSAEAHRERDIEG